MRESCAGCTHFKRRDPAGPWPIAGVSADVEGQCDAPIMGSKVDAWRPWRMSTDWCWQFKPRPAPQGAAQAPGPATTALPPPEPEARPGGALTRAWRRIWKRRSD